MVAPNYTAEWEIPILHVDDQDRVRVARGVNEGLEVIPVRGEHICLEEYPDGMVEGFCGRVRDHDGKHWLAAPALICASGPWTLVEPGPDA